jgi:hypothetical protein
MDCKRAHALCIGDRLATAECQSDSIAKAFAAFSHALLTDASGLNAQRVVSVYRAVITIYQRKLLPLDIVKPAAQRQRHHQLME